MKLQVAVRQSSAAEVRALPPTAEEMIGTTVGRHSNMTLSQIWAQIESLEKIVQSMSASKPRAPHLDADSVAIAHIGADAHRFGFQ